MTIKRAIWKIYAYSRYGETKILGYIEATDQVPMDLERYVN